MLTENQLSDLLKFIEESKSLHPVVTVAGVKLWVKKNTDITMTNVALRKELRRIGMEMDNCNCGEAAKVKPMRTSI